MAFEKCVLFSIKKRKKPKYKWKAAAFKFDPGHYTSGFNILSINKILKLFEINCEFNATSRLSPSCHHHVCMYRYAAAAVDHRNLVKNNRKQSNFSWTKFNKYALVDDIGVFFLLCSSSEIIIIILGWHVASTPRLYCFTGGKDRNEMHGYKSHCHFTSWMMRIEAND